MRSGIAAGRLVQLRGQVQEGVRVAEVAGHQVVVHGRDRPHGGVAGQGQGLGGVQVADDVLASRSASRPLMGSRARSTRWRRSSSAWPSQRRVSPAW